jgi:hypothetical protein
MTASETTPLGRALLLGIDLQAPFLAPIADREAVVRRCQFALTAANGLGLPVLFTEQVPAKLGPTLPALRACAPSAPVVAKNTFNALAPPAVRTWLDDHGTEHVLLTGIETPICVYQTALAAIAADLQVTLLTDCVAGRRTEDGTAVLAYLARLGVHLLPSETVFYSLLGDTDHPFFREFTQLVKGAAAPIPAAPGARRTLAP